MQKILLLPLLLIACSLSGRAQVAGFTIPDTVCEDKPVVITNVQPPAASTYKWSFCSGNANFEPDGLNMGSPEQLLNAPMFVTVVQDNQDYYSFITSSGNAKIIRCNYGSSLTQFPLQVTDLGSFSVLTNEVRGIQVKKHNGLWFGFAANGQSILKFEFGTSLANTPSSQVISLPAVSLGSGLAIVQQGADWYGFLTDIPTNTLFRLDFGPDLSNNPTLTSLGNVGLLSGPASVVIASEKGLWYAFICNIISSSLTRVEFGPFLSNPLPTGTNFSNIAVLNLNAGITITNDCGGVSGFVTNCINESDQCAVRLIFSAGLGGPVSGYQLANHGILNKPYGISECIRQGDTLYAFAVNYGSSTITRIFFPSCSGASQPFYSGPDPPPVTYAEPGSYNILLTVDGGATTQSSQCRQVVIIPKPGLSLGPDRMLCDGMTTVLDAGAGDSLYAWSTGAATRTITVDTTGTYWVRAVNFWNCEAMDTIRVTVNRTASKAIDTTICEGLTYWAQHAMQNTSGVYYDTLKLATGCDSIITTTLQVEECPLLMWFPNAFTPNGDGLNDVFRPVGKDIVKYSLQIFDRWGAIIFESGEITTGWNGQQKGREAMPDVYTYHATFESKQFPGIVHRETGTFTLAR